MAVWDEVIGERDRTVYAKAGYGQRGGLGTRPVVLVVDMTYAFTGERSEPILESIERWPNSCGEMAWSAVAKTAELLEKARSRGRGVIYTRGAFRGGGFKLGRWRTKFARALERPEGGPEPNEIVHAVAPGEGDIVIQKDKPSAFFGTPLMSYLNELDADSLLVTGGTTSGCVRATVTDAFSYNLATAVVADCVFDRGEISHKINLFDINQKYADVIGIDDALHYLDQLRADKSRSGPHAPEKKP